MRKKTLSMLMILSLVWICLAAPAPAADKKIIYMGDKAADLPFSPAILMGDTLFLSGTVAQDPATGKFKAGTMAEQAERTIQNLEILCRKAGMGLTNVVQATVFITDLAEFGEFNEVFKRFFPKDPPTRATVQVSKLAFDAKIEISAVAMK